MVDLVSEILKGSIWLLLPKIGGALCPTQTLCLGRFISLFISHVAQFMTQRGGFDPFMRGLASVMGWSLRREGSGMLEMAELSRHGLKNGCLEMPLWCIVKSWFINWVLTMSVILCSLELWFGIKALIEFICCPPTIHAILAICLSVVPHVDCFYWPLSADGRYTSKSGYQFLCMSSNSDAGLLSGVPSLSRVGWKKLWKAEALLRCRETGWRACRGVLLVHEKVRARGLKTDLTCPWCLGTPEIVQHTRPVVRSIWFASPLGSVSSKNDLCMIFCKILCRWPTLRFWGLFLGFSTQSEKLAMS